jgi:uncharacterized phage protein gp47/JayE
VTETVTERTGVCGCCEGLAESTPAALSNLPGLSALAYRVGTHGSFKETMLVGLSRHAALERLTTREDDDPTIALLDAWAAALDVLTFYQERIANEGYLGTALEQRSIRELARAIGYELGPGVAAETRLAFELETAPGAPESAVLPVGTKVQNVPGQDELPQTFETIEEIEARPKWNAFGPSVLTSTRPAMGAVELYVQGADTGIRPGDLLAFAGREWTSNPATGDFVLRHVATVEPDADAGVTRIGWSGGLEFPPDYVVGPEGTDVAAFIFRRRASLFGHNAPDWHAMPQAVQDAYKKAAGIDVNEQKDEWPGLTLTKVGAGKAENKKNRIFLDAIYSEIVGGCVALSAPGFSWLFAVTDVAEDARTDFTMSAKTTSIELDPRVVAETPGSGFTFDPYLRTTTVFAQSEELKLAEWPVQDSIWGAGIKLAETVPILPEDRQLIVSGLPAYITPGPNPPMSGWWLDPGNGEALLPILQREAFRVVSVSPTGNSQLQWKLDDEKGKSGTLLAEPDAISRVNPPDDAKILTELAVTAAPAVNGELMDTLTLASSLEQVYDRPSVRIAANVAQATHGEGRTEIVGGGDGSLRFQRFALKEGPLTYVQSAGSTGAATTLNMRVNGVPWREVRSLYGRGPRDRVYVVRVEDEGTAIIESGDGTTGARLPTGAQNLRAAHRVGTGLAGNLGAGKLTTLIGAPLGVKAVTNPLPATGGEDPETDDRARRSAPLTVLTFERIVSLDDAQDFAASFAGVGKAQATRVWDGEAEIVHLTIAAADGKPPEPGEPLLDNLREAVVSSGDPHLQVRVDPYAALSFTVEATVFVRPEDEPDEVLAAVRAGLADQFSFERRSFADPVALSEVVSTVQNVEGVEGVDLLGLHLVGEETKPNELLVAEPARFSGGSILPAQLLTLAAENVGVTAA